mmetsp:Transcript_137390/g.238973  ORF Transcript_137390/g.238973 Transcript_137390/m.238973 type:complete len:248 (-) Transcript_137390:2642-3385(-)
MGSQTQYSSSPPQLKALLHSVVPLTLEVLLLVCIQELEVYLLHLVPNAGQGCPPWLLSVDHRQPTIAPDSSPATQLSDHIVHVPETDLVPSDVRITTDNTIVLVRCHPPLTQRSIEILLLDTESHLGVPLVLSALPLYPGRRHVVACLNCCPLPTPFAFNPAKLPFHLNRIGHAVHLGHADVWNGLLWISVGLPPLPCQLCATLFVRNHLPFEDLLVGHGYNTPDISRDWTTKECLISPQLQHILRR